MEKHLWKAVRQNEKAGQVPNLRWGHCCAIIEDEVIFFGGYADSNYMNDIWSFNTITMEWTEIETTGDIPSNRSNCSMHYDKENDQLVVFGGGGANKQRFNSINLLSWKTKEWIEIAPKANESAPWARTYHTAELFYPNLVIYGGQGIADLDDIWIFNLITMTWKQIPISQGAVKPCARRFHASAKVGNEFFVIAGCHSKYRCLSDIYSIDLTKYFQTGRVEGLQWRERKMKDNTFLTRWGHTASVYEDKIYVFGGRFCNDLNDILVLDPSKDQITNLKVQGELPKARRRHSACFLGSCMLIFGGFNGEYFNDLNYIKINQSKKKLSVLSNQNREAIQGLQEIDSLQWCPVKSKEGGSIKICKGLIAPRFRDEDMINNFLNNIDQEMTEDELRSLTSILYKGYGKIDPQLIYHYGILIFDSKEEMEHQTRKSINKEERQSVMGIKKLKSLDPVISLDDHLFREFLERSTNEYQKYSDVTFNIKGEAFLRSNRALLALKSDYFRYLLSGTYKQQETTVPVPFNDPILFDIVLHYLTSGFVVTSNDYGHEFWVMLAEMAEYCSMTHLLTICEYQLVNRVSEMTCQQLLVIALEMNLSYLSRVCAEQIIRNMINQQKEEISDVFPEVKNETISYMREQVLKQVYGSLRFDILQKKIDSQQKEAAKHSNKSIDNANLQSQQQYKQNNEVKN